MSRAGWIGLCALVVLVAVIVLAARWRSADSAPAGSESTPAPATDATESPEGPTDALPDPSPAEPAVREVQTRSGVAVRLQRAPRIDVPVPPYGALYAQLSAGIETAPPAEQYRFGLLLYQCRDVPEQAAELAAKIEQVHQTRRLDGWDIGDPVIEEAALRRDFDNCAGIPAEARRAHRDWMKRAAGQGQMEAQLNLMYYLPKAEYCQFIEDCTPQQAAFMTGLREESRAAIQQALEAGSVEALRTVGSWALNDEMGPPDPIQAYAYLSAYDQVQQAAGRERELARMLEQIAERLRPVDQELAETRARELLANPNCCVMTR